MSNLNIMLIVMSSIAIFLAGNSMALGLVFINQKSKSSEKSGMVEIDPAELKRLRDATKPLEAGEILLRFDERERIKELESRQRLLEHNLDKLIAPGHDPDVLPMRPL